MRRQWYLGFGIILLIALAIFIMLKDIRWFLVFLAPVIILWIYDVTQKNTRFYVIFQSWGMFATF